MDAAERVGVKRDGVRARVEVVLLRAAAMNLHARDAVGGKHALGHLRAGDARGSGNAQVLVDLAIHVPRGAHADDHGDDDEG